MDEQEEAKNKIEELRQKYEERTTILRDPDAFKAYQQANAKPGPYRLELVYDEENHLLYLQGDRAGMESLLSIVKKLADPEAVVGSHSHLDSATQLTRADFDLIIMRVEST
ncbi:MAG: hypothetical protein IAE83_01665 [Anaerolinea sp.]|nr:hypothetical protein [Anaerolinea sp.]